MQEKAIKLADALKYYYQDKRAENIKESTLNTYKMHIDYFIEVNELQDAWTDFINLDLYDFFIEEMQEDDRKNDVTIATYCRSVRAFIYWLQDNHYTDEFQVKIPKYQQRVKVCYTDEELEKILEKPEKCSEVQYQAWVFINLICATALRLNSALDLKVKDIIEKENMLVVNTTKNRQGLTLYLNNDILKILKKYIGLFELAPDDYLFCKGDKGRMDNDTMKDYVRKYNRRLGIEKTSIHLFRHTFAKNFYKQEKDIYTLSKILDHSSISVTEQYLRDLGVSLFVESSYNPQQKFAQKKTAKRRGKLKI